MTTSLSNSIRIAAQLRERLAAEYNLSEDDEAITDTIEGECDLPEQIAKLARDVEQDEAFAEAIGAIIKVKQARKSRLEARAMKGRALILWALAEAGYRKKHPLTLPDMTLSLSDGKAPLIIDEGAELPKAYQRVKIEPDKAYIRQTLESGVKLDFARLGNASQTLSIRRT